MMQNRKIWFVLVIFSCCMACSEPETNQNVDSKPTNVINQEITEVESSVDKALREFKGGLYAKKLSTQGWTQAQWIEFIQKLPLDTENKKMKELDLIFDINETQDQKLLSVWSEQSIKNGYFIETEEIIHPFMVKTDDLSLVEPLYRAYLNRKRVKTAKAILDAAKPNYSENTYNSIKKLLK